MSQARKIKEKKKHCVFFLYEKFFIFVVKSLVNLTNRLKKRENVAHTHTNQKSERIKRRRKSGKKNSVSRIENNKKKTKNTFI